LQNKFVADLNTTNQDGCHGFLASSVAELLKDIWIGDNEAVAPWKFKKVISKFATQFSGYQQQDSQELLAYLIDGLHEDLNKVLEKPYTNEVEEKNKSDKELS
jgi:ubiquitin carboxyl-terminal hydrolase 4/11/15